MAEERPVRHWLGILLLAALPSLAADEPVTRQASDTWTTTTVYASVDANGIPSFSDTPEPGAVPRSYAYHTPGEDAVEREHRRLMQQLELMDRLAERQAGSEEQELRRELMRLEKKIASLEIDRLRTTGRPEQGYQTGIHDHLVSPFFFNRAYHGRAHPAGSRSRTPESAQPPSPVSRTASVRFTR